MTGETSAVLSAEEASARRAVAAPGASAREWHRLGLILIQAGKLAESRTCLEKVVELAPGSLDARNNLGIVLQRLGELAAARDMYQAALTLDPQNPGTLTNMAAVLGELGDFAAALDHAQRAVALEPSLVGPHVYAGFAEAGLGRDATALDWIDRALALAPASVPVLTARADALRRLDRVEEALAACRQALALEPQNGEARNTLGLICHKLGRDEEAVAAFAEAARLLPQPGTALANQAMVLIELGHREEAAEVLDRALAADPGLAAAWYARADMKVYRAGDPDIAAMEALLQPQQPAAGNRRPARQRDLDRLLLHYALGKAYLDIADARRAFDHLNAGSRLKRAAIAFDGQATARWMKEMARSFPPPIFARFGAAGEPSDTPIFVIGMPRSGTTLVQQILAALPGVHAAGEPRHVEHLTKALGAAYPAHPETLAPEQLADFGRNYLARVLGDAPRDTRRVIDKMPNNFLHAGIIHLALPGARIIHCRRDPVDTCLSCYSKLFTTGQEFSYDMAELGGYFRAYAALMAHWRAVLPSGSFIEVEYEKIVSDLEGEARRLIAFCGLDWDAACLRFHEARRAVRTASMNQVRRPLYAGSIGRWRTFASELGPLLEALGRD